MDRLALPGPVDIYIFEKFFAPGKIPTLRAGGRRGMINPSPETEI